jgi:hypothetical protein
MNKLHSSRAPHRKLISKTSNTDDCGAFQDPTHVSFWNSNSFWYYTRPEHAWFIDCPVLFHANRVKNFFPNDWHREHQIVCVKADLVRR